MPNWKRFQVGRLDKSDVDRAMATVTIRDVAKRAGVGIGTVSRVLNRNPNVSAATRQRILEAITELDFRPNLTAQRLSRGRTSVIGIIGPLFITESYVRRLQGVESILSNSDYDLVLFNVETVEQRERVFQRVARRERVDGLIIMSICPTEQEVLRLAAAGTPTVLVDAAHPQLNYVAVDDVAGGELATQHLLQLGHRKIGFMSDRLDDPLNFTANRDRLAGYQIALAEAGVDISPHYHVQGHRGGQETREMALKLLLSADPPTAIFAASDTHALGALEAARELNLQVPTHLSVIGYDDIGVARHLRLTTIRQPLFETGVEGIQLLLALINTAPAGLHQTWLPVDLVIRATTAAPSTHFQSNPSRRRLPTKPLN